MTTELYIGLMSGTSMDAVDCALVQIEDDKLNTLHFLSNPIPQLLKQQIFDLAHNQAVDLRTLGNTDIAVGKLFAETVLELLSISKIAASSITAIGSHGQTIWHEPPQSAREHPFTLQIGDPNTIAELTGITTVADFRRRDMAAGGQGAPIVPALHWTLFRNAAVDRVVLNLGGIANITFLPKSGAAPLGMDTGPANALMDAWASLYLKQPYDAEGVWAATARPNPELLQFMMQEPYFSRPAPKSTGRELFNQGWLDAKIGMLAQRPTPAEIQATLLELTTESISREIEKLANSGEILVCGGGVRNKALMANLGKRLPGFKLGTSTEHGLHADYVEAVAFAWFASKTLKRKPMGFDPFTGASHAVIAGGIYYA